MKRFILLIMTLLPALSMAQRQVSDAEVEALHDRIISIDTHNDFSLAYCFPDGKYSTAKAPT